MSNRHIIPAGERRQRRLRSSQKEEEKKKNKEANHEGAKTPREE